MILDVGGVRRWATQLFYFNLLIITELHLEPMSQGAEESSLR